RDRERDGESPVAPPVQPLASGHGATVPARQEPAHHPARRSARRHVHPRGLRRIASRGDDTGQAPLLRSKPMSTKEHTMYEQPALARVGAASGAIFAIVLFVANGDGSNTFSGPRAVAAIAALTVAFPFISYLCSILRDAEGASGWLASTALVTGV